MTAGGPGGGPMWIADMSLKSAISNGKRWTGEVEITIEGSGGAVADAAVSGTWSGGAKGKSSCVTGGAGTCSVSKSAKSGETMTFTVDDVSHATLTYDPASNGVDDFLTISE